MTNKTIAKELYIWNLENRTIAHELFILNDSWCYMANSDTRQRIEFIRECQKTLMICHVKRDNGFDADSVDFEARIEELIEAVIQSVVDDNTT